MLLREPGLELELDLLEAWVRTGQRSLIGYLFYMNPGQNFRSLDASKLTI